MSCEKKPPLIIIAGPTAVGKTAVSIGLAERIGGEIVSADSVQVYRTLDIGSAKVTKEEMRGIPHHLIDVLEPEENYDVQRFQEMAEEAVRGIQERGHYPIIAGGTGFYIQSLLYGIHFQSEDTDQQKAIRERLTKEAETEAGREAMFLRLKETDPASAAWIHPNNVCRVIRALEFHALHGYPISQHNAEEARREPVFDTLFFVLNDDRESLNSRINARVDGMVRDGLVEEARRLYERNLPKDSTALKGIGYRELIEAFEGKVSPETAIENIKKDSRSYAKRQITWFKRYPDAVWVNIRDYNYEKESIIRWITEQCTEHFQ